MILKRLLVVVVGVIVSLCASTYLSGLLYRQFRAEELATTEKFDALNMEVFNALPPPPGVVELDRSSNGITSQASDHGRMLIVQYKASDKAYDVAGYYQNLFKIQGWTPTKIYSETLYIRDTTCIRIYNIGNNTREYWLEIWHDFAKQAFSPPLPPKLWLEIYEFGETYIYTCP